MALEPEATCLGAGILAAYGAGLFPSISEAAATMTGTGRSYAPVPEQSSKYDQLFGLYKDIYPSLREQFTRLRQVIKDIG